MRTSLRVQGLEGVLAKESSGGELPERVLLQRADMRLTC